ncbi:MAG: DNA polymerase ligase N-terminal domain-containing protein, partial [Pseudomonadota bacterium]
MGREGRHQDHCRRRPRATGLVDFPSKSPQSDAHVDAGRVQQKRRFMRTPEPFGQVGQSDSDALRFVINHHAAKRLHFDLRLEWNGVLLSGAVPEGPSLHPKNKRLAIRTEDYPLDYLGFEGTIPKDEYGAGALRIWDRGTWVPIDEDPQAAFDAGEVKFRLACERLAGGWMLKKLPDGEKPGLLIKERDPSVVKGHQIDAAPLTSRRLARLVICPNAGR